MAEIPPVLAFGTKAETLERLQGRLTRGRVLPLHKFLAHSWATCKDEILDQIRQGFTDELLVVRSSAAAEDSDVESMAGRFTSVLEVRRTDRKALASAIDEVVSSYGKPTDRCQVFVQPQLPNVTMSGVLFTRDIDTLAPYYVATFDETGSTTSVTAGSAGTRTYLRSRTSPSNPPTPKLARLIEAAKELEVVFQSDRLDIEFAFDKEGELYIFQVRPITKRSEQVQVKDALVHRAMDRIFERLNSLNCPHPHLCGGRVIFSNMTDWNPAEIVGVRPRPLALSLYKELVTDSTWAYQRDNYGYKNLRSFPLLHSFMGLPYIDVRASLNSFVPKALDSGLSQKLVEYYIRQLCETPSDHDKVEFNIIYSCYYLDLPHKVKKLLSHGFSELELDRIKYALLNLTNEVICGRNGLHLKDAEKISVLEERFQQVNNSSLPAIDKIYWLLEDCKRYGTLPFAGLARAGFIAVQFLKSFVELGIFSDEDYHRYMNSLNTVAKQLARDSMALRNGNLSQEQFLEKYGHLRPGTYDILSPNYNKAFDTYFSTSEVGEDETEGAPFILSDRHREEISKKLIENGILVGVDGLMAFIKRAIEGREYSKFVFTRHLSSILELLADLGAEYGMSRDDLSFVDIRTIASAYSMLDHEELKEGLQREVVRNREAYRITESVRLPQIITEPHDVYDFFLGEVEPNYVTRGRTTNIVVSELNLPRLDLTNKIVCIERADPGYDWLFSRNIAGLITMYGGANSHMAIRCAELKIPAVIGCGEENFKRWASSSILDIDCANRSVRVVGKGPGEER